ncbi:MAG TPA: Pr6Pr family membrane protein [Devosiaceae bacterium]|nr:Pr6Pr family membrane protein [Devosiaceae bacterium]
MAWHRALAPVGLSVGLVGLTVDFAIIVPSLMTVSAGDPIALSLPGALVSFWTYFTHLTNLGLLLVYLSVLSSWRGLAWFRRPRAMAAMAVYITLVMVYYHFMLAPYYQFEGPLLLATILLHYVAPLCYLGWWAMAVPHGQLRARDVLWILVPGLAYVAWVLLRGALTGQYPYDILDAGRFGYLTVGTGVGALALAVSTIAGVAVLVDRLLARHRHPA